MADDRQKWLGDVYSAKMLSAICQAMGNEPVSYEEFVGLVEQDNRTGQEIINDLIEEHERRKKQEGRGKAWIYLRL